MKIENTRLDVASRKPFPKSALLRIVMRLGVVVPDPDNELPGRGVYLLRSKDALETAIKKKAFERAFHRPLREEEITSIKEAL